MGKPFLSIVIPARNEERRLPQTLDQLVRFLEKQSYSAEVIVVINASTDRSLEIVRSYGNRHPHIRSISQNVPGKGSAVKTGMLAAKGAYRFFADVDLSMPVEELNRFIPPAIDVPIAIASREAPGAVRYHEPFYRHITGRAFNALIRLMVLPKLKDTQCGFKMFREEAAEDLFPRQTLRGWSFDIELLHAAGLRGYPVVEVPVPWFFNPETKLSVLRDTVPMFLDLCRVRRNGKAGKYA
jgi:glycosyltransferase involved in cell wall biosynthesis